MCCENQTTQKEHDKEHVDQCVDCDCDVDKDGDCIEMNDCSYSPLDCETCGYRPCDQSC
jgi:hypothetical protein